MLLKKIMKRLKTEKKHLLRFLISRILWHTGLCNFFLINHEKYKIRFFPTALSASLWLNPNILKKDEDFFEQYLKFDDVAIDIGANIGALTLFASRNVGEKGKVFSFEPDPKIFRYLQSNLDINGCKNIELFNCALGEKKGIVSFSQKKSDDQNRIVKNKNSQKVPIECLDECISKELCNLTNIALLKVDVEGYEKYVLQGAKKILSKCECIYFESAESHFNQYGYQTKDLFLLLERSNFEIYKIIQNSIQKLPISYFSEQCENLIAIRSLDNFISRTGFKLVSPC